jgi:hypothetical protein
MINNSSLEDLIAQYKNTMDIQMANISPDEVAERINNAIIENIPDEKLAEFEQIFDEKNDEKIMSFLKTEIPNLESIIIQALS